MSTNRDYLQGLSVLRQMSDRDWITILSALLRDDLPESRRLARFLLQKTKHGRQVRLLSFLSVAGRTVRQVQTHFKVSRRSVFRDLNDLEAYGARLAIGAGWHYEIQRLPSNLQRLVSLDSGK